MDDVQYVWKILPDISRTFAFTIPKLPKDVGTDLAIAYAICRIIDTIEDSDLELSQKKELINSLIDVLSNPTSPAEEFYASVKNVSVRVYEELMANADRVMGAYKSRPTAVQEIIAEDAITMARGFVDEEVQNISTIQHQNTYCYYAAGIVGRIITKLFGYYGYLSQSEVEELLPLAQDVGLALQKVNIMKDIVSDLREGRCYWPSELLHKHGLTYETVGLPEKTEQSLQVLHELLDDVKHYFEKSLRYISRLPHKPEGLRIFCADNVLMAIATARTIKTPRLFSEKVKITRDEVYAIDREVTDYVKNGQNLDKLAYLVSKSPLC